MQEEVTSWRMMAFCPAWLATLHDGMPLASRSNKQVASRLGLHQLVLAMQNWPKGTASPCVLAKA